MNLTLKIWRQKDAKSKGKFVTYTLNEISPNCSFLEMLDILNENLIGTNEEPVVFDHDCREGICGMCSLYINGRPHGPDDAVTACQLHMRKFKDGDTITVEPWRAKPFPVIKDLMVDRTAFDRIIQEGGYISVNTGGAMEANHILVPKPAAELSMDAAACIGCGACVAACKNASAMLFVGAKVAHLALLPQGHPERSERVRNMVVAMDQEQFGSCTNTLECEAVCPKSISTEVIGRMNRELIRSTVG